MDSGREKSAKSEQGFTRRKGKPKEKGKHEIHHHKLKSDDKNYNMMRALKRAVDNEKLELYKKIEANVEELADQIMYTVENTMGMDVPEKDIRLMTPPTSSSSSEPFSEKATMFHEKTFRIRNALLTDLFRVSHINTIYHIFIAFLINLLINTAISDVVKLGNINLGFELIYWNFSYLPDGIFVWISMQLITIVTYFALSAWAYQRLRLGRSLQIIVWNFLFLMIALFYTIAFILLPAFTVYSNSWPIAISFSVLMEQVRFLMKTYSFIRTVVPRVSQARQPGYRAQSVNFPSLEQFVYFLFAPTLIFRDEYPRTSKIRWKIVFTHALEIIGVIFYLAFIWENYLIPTMKDFGKGPLTSEEIILTFFHNNIPCLFAFLCGFYSFLHSWQNAFAELMMFGDRMFYQDWWNSSSFAEFCKTWNVMVYDWLYAFIYKDATENLTNNKKVSTWLVFIISALFHEYILAFSFKFCYPVLFVVFGILGTCLMFIPKKRNSAVANMFLWFGLFMGTGCCGSLYMLEYYARQNCPRLVLTNVEDFFTPRSWQCVFGRLMGKFMGKYG